MNNNTGKDYTWDADPTIGGSLTGRMSLTKKGEGSLSIYTDNSYSGDTIIEAGRLVVGSADALGLGTVRLLGGTLEIAANGFDNTITAAGTAEILVQQGSTLKLNRKIYNTEGVLTLNGIIDVSALESTTISSTMVDVNGELGDSGFTRGAATGVQLVQGGTVEATGATVLYNGEVMTVDRTGFASSAPTIDYSVYSINGRHAVDASEISSVAGSALSRIDLNSGTLTADIAISNLKATGGTLLMPNQVLVNGTVQDTMIYASAGQLNATLSGGTAVQVSGAVTISGNNTHTGGTILNNGTLTVTNAKALGTGSIITQGTSSIKANAALTLNQAIINTGTLTLSGRYNVSGLDLIGGSSVRVDATGKSGASGFLKAGGDRVLVVAGGTVVNNGATVTYNGTNLTLGNDGYASFGGSGIDYSEYLLIGTDSAATATIHTGAGAGARIRQQGGTLTVNDMAEVTATGGSIVLTSGGVLNGTLSGTAISASGGSLMATLSGSNNLQGEDFALTSLLNNEGLLLMSGSFDVSALELEATQGGRVDLNGSVSSAGNGFERSAGYCVQLTTGGSTGNAGATISHNGILLQLGTDGYASTGGVTDYSVYHLTTGSATSLAIHNVSAPATIDLTGGTLTVNDTATVMSNGGSIVVMTGGDLRGSVSGSDITARGGSIDAVFNGSNTLTGDNYSLAGVLQNTGTLTLTGSFRAEALQLETVQGTRINAEGQSGTSGFLQNSGFRTQVVSGGSVINGGATIKYGNTSLTLGSDGYATSGGGIDYSEYLLTGSDAAVLSKITKAGGSSLANIKMNGGVLTADTTSGLLTATGGTINLISGTLGGSINGATVNASGGTLNATLTGSTSVQISGVVSMSGNNSHTGGLLLNNGVLTLAGTAAAGSGAIISMGSSSIKATGTLALNDVMMNMGTLTLSGIFDISALERDTQGSAYVDANNMVSTSGFLQSGGYRVQVVNGGRVVNNGAVITYNNDTLTLGSDGYASSGGGITYATYYLNAGDSVTVSAAQVASGYSMNSIQMSGGTLYADAATQVVSTGGNINLSRGALSGSIKNAIVSVTGGTLSADLSGSTSVALSGVVSISGNNTHSGGTSFNGGSFTLDNASALGYGRVMISGTNSLTANSTITLNNVIFNSGALNITGTFDATNLDLSSVGTTYIDVDGHSGESGFQRSGGYSVQVVSGGTVSGAATIKHGSHTLTLSSDGYATSGGGITYSTYYLNGSDSVKVSEAELASANALTAVTMTGGTLYADATTKVTATGGNIQLSSGTLSGTIKNTDVHATGGSLSAILSGTTTLSAKGTVILSAANTHTGGTIFNGGSFTLSNANALGNGTVMTTGTNTISATTTITLNSEIFNSGALTMSGTYNASALSLDTLNGGYVDADGNVANSGFISSGGYRVQVVNGGTVSGSATIKHGSYTLTLGSDGYATSSGGVAYDTYYLRGTDSVSVSAAKTASANALTAVNMTGGTLYADATTRVTATGGNIVLSGGTLSGTVKDTAVNATGGSLSATLSGATSLSATGTVTISGANTHTAGSMFRGGSFTLSNANALGSGTVMTTGTNTISASTAVTLNSVILNSGALTMTGTYNAATLSLETLSGGYVDVNGYAGESGFSKAAGYRVLVVNGGTVGGSATIKHGSYTLTLGSDGYATGGGGITYGTYYLKGIDSVKVSEAEAASANALTAVTMTGGMLYADASTKVTATGGNIQLSSGTLSGTIKDTAVHATAGTLSATLSGSSTLMAKGTVTLSGSNTHTGGTMFNGGTFTLSNANALGSGTVMTTGTNTLKGNTAQSLKSTILNSGTLTLSGSWNLSSLALNTQAATHVDVDGRTGDSGFSKTALYEVQVVQGGTSKASNLTLTHSKLASGLQLVLGSNGVAAVGGVVDYNTYYLTGRDSVSVSEAESASGSALNHIVMSGGNLTADASTKLTATGGSITVTDDATLSGTITNTDVTFDQGNYSANITAAIKGNGSLTINGGDVTLSGSNSYTGGTTLNGGSLTATNAAVLGSGTVTVNGGTLDLNNQKVDNDISLNNGSLVGNNNYNGNLSIGGDNVAVEGGYTLGAGKVLEIAAGGTEFSTDLTLSGGTLLFRGAPLTVDGEVSFAAGTTTLVDLRSWEGQLTNGLTLAVLGSDVTGWTDGCLELIGMSNMELLFDDSTGSLTLQIAGAAPVVETITWLGAKGTVWQNGRAGWMNATTGYDAVFESGADVIFTQPGTVTIAGAVEPGSLIVAGDKAITFKADKLNPGRIVGNCTLTKRGNGKLTLNDGNTYSGGTLIEAGTVIAGGATSFGRGDITISGGTLDLKGKAVANDITLTDAATIKAGKLYGGSFTMNGDLLKGSLLNIGAGETATLVSGTMDGTLSGTGTVAVTGDVTIGTSAKVTTDELEVSGSLAVGSKGLSMNTKASAITVTSGGQLISEGALKAAALIVDGGQLELHSDKASSIAITNNTYLANGATVTTFANVKTTNLTMESGSQLTLGAPRRNTWAFRPTGGSSSSSSSAVALSLTVSGNMNLTSSALTLSGKISAGNLSITDSYVNMTSGKLQTIAVKNSLTLSGNNCFVFDFDAANGTSYKLFTYKSLISDGNSLTELFGWEKNSSYTLTANANDITLTVLNAAAWEAYMDELANSLGVATLSLDDELVESSGTETESEQVVVTTAAAGIDPRLGKVADTLVQSTWGTAGASRAFADTIAARGTHATALADGKAAAWISTMGGSSRISSDDGHAGADYTLTGAAFGMEASLSEKSTVGLAIGNSWGKVSTFSAYPVDQDSTHQGIYGKHLLGSSTTLSWMAAHTRTESDANLAGMACDWTQDALQLDARVDKLFAVSDRTTVSAFVGMQYLATDKGECNGLSTGSLQNLRGEIGVSAAHKATDKGYVYGELSFIGDMARNNPTATVGDYRSRGANPGRAGLNLSVGASYQLNDSWSLNGSYSLELMQNQTSHSANIGATYSF